MNVVVVEILEAEQSFKSTRERLIVSVRGRETHTDIRAVSCSGRPSDKDQKEGMNVRRSGVLTCRPGINRRRKTTANGRQFIIADSQQGEKRNKERPLSIDKEAAERFFVWRRLNVNAQQEQLNGGGLRWSGTQWCSRLMFKVKDGGETIPEKRENIFLMGL
ncbi:predicted protein [Histoplasma capsulatum G186AR]|uniref:Uncharacterized protein n=1 Tax=Ajellomyces capsulatus (strain G186AR / H82 / ATCC MYA-2454 / RMSCC 2432) TaxID=447093 RepID=C0NC19_AJECG|nr:uncharacterized protein HCBG_00665 [Histoplasma capsulatum G186AR]EEH11210.1 predicted protein [Histoplasma capsulatum G186AR]